MFSILSASKSNNTQTVPTVSPNVLIPRKFRGHCKLNNGKSANPKFINFVFQNNSKPLQRDRQKDLSLFQSN